VLAVVRRVSAVTHKYRILRKQVMRRCIDTGQEAIPVARGQLREAAGIYPVRSVTIRDSGNPIRPCAGLAVGETGGASGEDSKRLGGGARAGW